MSDWDDIFEREYETRKQTPGKYASFNGWRDVKEVWSLETARAIAEHWNSQWSDRCAVVVRHFHRC
jgi:hypothetical protein